MKNIVDYIYIPKRYYLRETKTPIEKIFGELWEDYYKYADAYSKYGDIYYNFWEFTVGKELGNQWIFMLIDRKIMVLLYD